MRGIADQYHATAVPGLGHQDGLERPVVDGVCIGGHDRLAYLGHDAAPVRRQVEQPLRLFLNRNPLMIRTVLEQEHVHVGTGYRVETELGVFTHIKVCGIETRRPLGDDAVDHLPGEFGPRRRRRITRSMPATSMPGGGAGRRLNCTSRSATSLNAPVCSS